MEPSDRIATRILEFIRTARPVLCLHCGQRLQSDTCALCTPKDHMDPDANIEEQRRLAKRMIEAPLLRAEDSVRLSELVIALDEWLSKGGFPPKDWHAPHHR